MPDEEMDALGADERQLAQEDAKPTSQRKDAGSQQSGSAHGGPRNTFAIQAKGNVSVVTSSDLSSMTAYVMVEQEDWFEQEMAFVRALAQPGMQVLDIGANHGVYSLAFASAIGANGKVWAFEPTGIPFAMLCASVQANGFEGRLIPVRMGLSDSARHEKMYVSSHSELNSLHSQIGQVEEVELETLDHVLPKLASKARIDFVKLDAEGEEVNIVRGGAQFFKEQSPLVMFEVRHGAEFNHGLWDAFRAMGYGLFRLLPGLNLLTPADTSLPFETFQLNLFAAKHDRQLQLAGRGLLAHEAVPTLKDGLRVNWIEAFRHLPYAQSFLPRWRCMRSNLSEQICDLHVTALNAYLTARTTSHLPEQRVALLMQAVQLWTQVHREEPEQLSVGLCLARANVDLGERANALSILRDTMQRMASASTNAFGLPFLPPCEDFDLVAPQGGVLSWLSASMLEAFETWRAFSSYFTSDTAQLIAPHLENPDLSSAMKRRYVLHARRAGAHFTASQYQALKLTDPASPNALVWQQLAGTHRTKPVRNIDAMTI